MKLLYLAPIAFEYIRARPQWLSVHLARLGYEVYYVNPPALSISLLWHCRDMRVRKEIKERNYVLTRIIMPRGIKIGRFKTKLPRERFFQKLWFKNFLEKEKINPNEDIFIVANPRFWQPLIGGLNLRKVYYDCQDHWSVMSGSMDKVEYLKLEEELVKSSSAVFVTSEKLKEHVKALYQDAKTYLIPNAIDWETITESKADAIKKSDRKVVGLIGSIDHEWVNLELIKKAALKYPQFDFVLVGPLKPISAARRILGELENVKLVGEVPYTDVGAWIKCFDVGIIPFNRGETADHTEPIKAYEYMALGKPVLAHNLKEVEKFGELAVVTYDEENFLSALVELAEEKKTGLINARIETAKANTWEARARLIHQIITKE